MSMLQQLVEGWKMAAAGLTAILSVGAILWGGFDYITTIEGKIDKNAAQIEVVGASVQQLQEDKAWSRFLSLDKLRREFGLDEKQYQVWCQLAIKLKARKDCPPYRGRRKRSD